jgi:hypothetical protein
MLKMLAKLALCWTLISLVSACGTTAVDAANDSSIVEASCGQCQFDLEGDGCDLAVRFGDGAWFVDGTGINDHGDSHADDGFCNAVRKARVTGEVVGDRFVATEFELLPEEEA